MTCTPVFQYTPSSNFHLGYQRKYFSLWVSLTTTARETFSTKVDVLIFRHSPRKRSADMMLQQFLSSESRRPSIESQRRELLSPNTDLSIMDDRDIPIHWLWPSTLTNQHRGPRPRFISSPALGLHYYNDWIAGKRGKKDRINSYCQNPFHIF